VFTAHLLPLTILSYMNSSFIKKIIIAHFLVSVSFSLLDEDEVMKPQMACKVKKTPKIED
jgi:hypothetical protein